MRTHGSQRNGGIVALVRRAVAVVRKHYANAPTLRSADIVTVRAVLGSGATPQAALAATTTTALEPARRGISVGVPLGKLVDAPGLTDTAASLIRALAVAEAAGTPPGPALNGVLDSVTDRNRLAGVIATKSADAVLTVRMLSGLPFIALLGMAMLNPKTVTFFQTPIGVVVVAVAVSLIGLATWWMKRMIVAVNRAAWYNDPLNTEDKLGWRFWAATATGGVVGVVVYGAVGGLLGVGLGSVAVTMRRRTDTDSLPVVTPRELPPTAEALDLLSVALAGGMPLETACRTVAEIIDEPARTAFNRAADGVQAGIDVDTAFIEPLSETAGAIQTSRRWGAPIAETLRILAADLRDRAAIAAEHAAEQLAVRLVLPTSLLLVPAVLLIVVAPFVATAVADLGGTLQLHN